MVNKPQSQYFWETSPVRPGCPKQVGSSDYCKFVCMPNFSFLGELEVMFLGWVGGQPESYNKAISIALDLPRTETGTEPCNSVKDKSIKSF